METPARYKSDGDIEVRDRGGQAVVCSLEVAQHYEKRHDNVLATIARLIETEPECSKMFFLSTYLNSGNHEYPCYYMNRDGFSILTMGFTGAKALRWKVRYIQAFNGLRRDSYQIDDPVARARRWIEEQQEKLRLQSRIEKLEPKAESFDQICASKNATSLTETAKLLGLKRKDFVEMLERKHYLYRNGHNVLLPYAKHTDTIFSLKRVPYGSPWKNENGEICQNTNLSTYVTMEGIHKLRRLFLKWGVSVA